MGRNDREFDSDDPVNQPVDDGPDEYDGGGYESSPYRRPSRSPSHQISPQPYSSPPAQQQDGCGCLALIGIGAGLLAGGFLVRALMLA